MVSATTQWLSQLFLDFRVYTQGVGSKTNPELQEISGDIFEKVWSVCVECYILDSLLHYRPGKKKMLLFRKEQKTIGLSQSWLSFGLQTRKKQNVVVLLSLSERTKDNWVVTVLTLFWSTDSEDTKCCCFVVSGESTKDNWVATVEL